MFEITLPCCDRPAVIEADASMVRCEACAIELDLAPDAQPAVAEPGSLPIAA